MALSRCSATISVVVARAGTVSARMQDRGWGAAEAYVWGLWAGAVSHPCLQGMVVAEARRPCRTRLDARSEAAWEEYC